MNNDKNNIPAFPCVIKDREFPNNSELERLPGMTLRDYFADSAMTKMIEQYGPISGAKYGSNLREEISRESYLIADAMLKERNLK